MEPKHQGANWDRSEKDHLISILDKHISVIENKECDRVSKKRKDAAWSMVEEIFQAKFGQSRPNKALRDQWKRMKITAKQEYANQKPKTGGGPPPLPPSYLSQKVKELCPQEFIQIYSRYDDVSSTSPDQTESEKVSPMEFLNPMLQGFQMETDLQK